MIYQSESCECGLACLAMIANRHGAQYTLAAIRERYPVSMRGTTLRHLIEIASRLGLSGRPVRCDLGQLARVQTPALLHWDFEHFVVLTGAGNGRFVVHDPALGILVLDEAEVSQHFTGVALELAPAEDFKPRRAGERLDVFKLARVVGGLRPYLGEILWLTAAVEALALIAPFFVSFMFDKGVRAVSDDVVVSIAIGFALVALFHAGLTAARDIVVAEFGAAFNESVMQRLVRHMLRLPLAFFERHNIGDLIDRYQSSNNLRILFSQNLPTLLLDGLFSIAAVAAMAFLSPTLALIAVLSFATYAGVSRLALPYVRTRVEMTVKARSEENGQIIETFRSVQAVKIYGKELERFEVWSGYHGRLMDADRRLLRARAGLNGARIFILGADLACSAVVAALAIRHGSLALSAFFAFLLLRAQFTVKGFALIDQLFEVVLAGVDIDRLGEIAFAEPEPVVETPMRRDAGAPMYHVQGLSYRYAPAEPFVLKDVDFTIEEGEFAVVAGPSGVGKSTLLKLMVGLLQPTEGDIRYFGQPLSGFDTRLLRRQVGVVMQEDRLLNGTILDNITFFDNQPDDELVFEVMRLALIEKDVLAMPMTLNTQMGDLAAALSGGQKQRLLLARALYRRPRFLLMDEGTANLDEGNELQIIDNIRSLGITCISAAHKPQVIAAADRVIELPGPACPAITWPMQSLERERRNASHAHHNAS